MSVVVIFSCLKIFKHTQEKAGFLSEILRPIFGASLQCILMLDLKLNNVENIKKKKAVLGVEYSLFKNV
jgi:hypothetical protein